MKSMYVSLFEPKMSTTSPIQHAATDHVRGRIIEAEVKISVSPAFPLPLASALYAVEAAEGVWLCAYYGANRSVFDYLPQKGAELDETRAGITFHTRQFVPKAQYQPALWEEFKKARLMTFKPE
jgi:hypothetical protein